MTNVEPTSLVKYNSADSGAALGLTLHWCAAPRWAKAVCASRPFATLPDLQTTTERLWQETDEQDRLEAFAAHPVIGDVELLRSKFASTANAEQGQVLDASDAIIESLAEQNIVYREKYGFTFIVFATGKSAAQMLDLLAARLGNSREEEIHNASVEQLKIMQLRLRQSLTDIAPTANRN